MSRPRKSKQEEEEETVQHFLNVVQSKLVGNRDLEAMVLDNESEEYRAEQNLLMQVNNLGLVEGSIAGIVTFASLVAGPHVIRHLRGGYRLQTPPQKTGVGTFALKVARLGLQAAASLVVAAYTTSYFTNEHTMLAIMASTPLVEGRSVIADEFCAQVTREYHRVHPPEYWKNVESPYLKYLGVFVENCQRRKQYEQDVRLESGLNQHVAVSIPPPGVPPNYRHDPQTFLRDEEDNSKEGDYEWAESLVTDREMQNDDSNE